MRLVLAMVCLRVQLAPVGRFVDRSPSAGVKYIRTHGRVGLYVIKIAALYQWPANAFICGSVNATLVAAKMTSVLMGQTTVLDQICIWSIPVESCGGKGDTAIERQEHAHRIVVCTITISCGYVDPSAVWWMIMLETPSVARLSVLVNQVLPPSFDCQSPPPEVPADKWCCCW